MKAKLGYLCSSISWGGLEMNHLRNAKWMQERGHSVVFLCVKDSPLEKSAREFELNVVTIDKHKKYYDFKNARKLIDIINAEGVSHLLIRSTSDMSILATVKHKLKSKIHTSYFMEMQIGVKKTHLLHTLRYKYIDVWSCPLNWLSEQVKELTNFNNQNVVIPSGLDLTQFENLEEQSASRVQLEFPTDKLIFGLIGRFDIQKGQLLLLEAMQQCKNKDFCVALLGETTVNEGAEYFKEMQEVIKQNHLENRVFLRPFRKDTETFYNAIDWMVMATKAETFGMVTIEALACGTPVLGSNAGGTPEILSKEKGGLLFTSLDSKDLALKLDDISSNRKEVKSSELHQLAQQYDHNEVCKQVEQILLLK